MEVLPTISPGGEESNDGFVLEKPPSDPSDEAPDILVTIEVKSDGWIEVSNRTEEVQKDDNEVDSFEASSSGALVKEQCLLSKPQEMPATGMVKDVQSIDTAQSNGLTSYAFDNSILLPPWNHRRGCVPAIPIADMRGVDSLNYSKAEKSLRCKLAATYRLVDMFGWSDGVNASISALANSGDILVSPVGILHHEVTASNLVKVSQDGSVVDPGSTGLDADTNDVALHSAIYRMRDDIRCIMHFNSPFAVSFSVLKCGLLPLCPEAMELGEITYSDYLGTICTEDDEKLLGLVQNHNSKVMFVRNFGVVVGGESVEQALNVAHNVMAAIELQFNILPLGLANFHVPSEEKQHVVYEGSKKSFPDIQPAKFDRHPEDVKFEGFMRMLDGAGYQTGYLYRHSLMSKRAARSQSLMNEPQFFKSTVANISGSMLQNGNADSCEPSRSVTPSSSRGDKVRVTKSVIEDDHSGKLTSHRFIPLNTDVREYKQKVKEIRKDFLPSNKSSGPHSTILEGVTWEEVRRIKESQGSSGRDGAINVTAASRGIIQREHQKSAVFYTELSASNPFNAKSQKEVDSYMQEIQRKTEPSEEIKIPKQQESTKETSGKEIEDQKTESVNKSFTANKSLSIRSSNDHARKGEVTAETNTRLGDDEIFQFSASQENKIVADISNEQSHSFCVEADATTEHSSTELDKAKICKLETASSLKQEILQESRPDLSPVVAPTEVPAKEEEKQAKHHTRIESQHSSQEASSSKSGKLKKSLSVQEKERKIEDISHPEDVQGGVELREKDKEKKKKRGLSAIFSKKKKVPTATLR